MDFMLQLTHYPAQQPRHLEAKQAVTIWLTISGCFWHHQQLAEAYGKFDPCNTPGLASRGGGFFLGLAFWPGGSVEDWGPVYDSTTYQFGLHPCNLTHNYTDTGLSPSAYLASRNVSVASFEVKMDSLMAMSVNNTDIAYLVNRTLSEASYISMIAFRGAFRSEPVYIYSSNAAATQATGFVTSLSLTLKFSKGSLTYLQWSDFSCNSCGGQLSSACLVTKQTQPQRSCPVSASECSNVTDCSLSVFGGFSGSDRHSSSLTTGLQLSKINQFALSSYFYNALEQLSRLKQSISTTGEIGGNSSPSAGGDAA